jgi:ABC-type glutathione transport system ATPase component
MGESGSGKSTLLNLIAGLDRPDSGRVLFEGTDLATLDDDALTRWRRASVGFVFQAFHVLPYLTVLQNVALPLDLLGVGDPQRQQRVLQMLKACGIAPWRCAMRASCPAGSCSALRSRVRWYIGRGWCWPTSRPAISTGARRSRSCSCCANSCTATPPARS